MGKQPKGMRAPCNMCGAVVGSRNLRTNSYIREFRDGSAELLVARMCRSCERDLERFGWEFFTR